MQKKNEVDEVKRLRERIHQLESALADTEIRNLLNESYLELACERLDEPVETFKKNTPSMDPQEQGKSPENEHQAIM